MIDTPEKGFGRVVEAIGPTFPFLKKEYFYLILLWERNLQGRIRMVGTPFYVMVQGQIACCYNSSLYQSVIFFWVGRITKVSSYFALGLLNICDFAFKMYFSIFVNICPHKLNMLDLMTNYIQQF